jgi:hypothetical protein
MGSIHAVTHCVSLFPATPSPSAAMITFLDIQYPSLVLPYKPAEWHLSRSWHIQNDNGDDTNMVVVSLSFIVLSGRMMGSVTTAVVPLTLWLVGTEDGGTTLPTTSAVVVGAMVGSGLGTAVGSTVGLVVVVASFFIMSRTGTLEGWPDGRNDCVTVGGVLETVTVGVGEGFVVGTLLGNPEGVVVAASRSIDGTPLTETVGAVLGRKVVGSELGVSLGDREGVPIGATVGVGLAGATLGALESTRLGIMDGTMLGKDDGTLLAISDGLLLGCWLGVLLGDGEGSQLETWLGNNEGAELG